MSLREHTRPGLGIIEPCLPSPAERRPSGPGWLHEIKHEGFRIMARRDGAGIRLITRHGNDFTNRFPIIVAAVRALPIQSFLIDGEAISPTATVSPCSTSFATSDMAARCSALHDGAFGGLFSCGYQCDPANATRTSNEKANANARPSPTATASGNPSRMAFSSKTRGERCPNHPLVAFTKLSRLCKEYAKLHQLPRLIFWKAPRRREAASGGAAYQ
jgi:hypothetical protein